MAVRLAVRAIKQARSNRQVHPNKQCADIGRSARSGADYAVRTAVLVSWLFLMAVAARGASLAQENEQHGDIEVRVVLDTAEQPARASATVRIHAERELVWSLVTICAEAVKMVPGLADCEVLETASD